jgi:hypothetical protein
MKNVVQYWWVLIVLWVAVACAANSGCAASRFVVNPETGAVELVTEGSHILPGAAEAIGDNVVEDLVGSALEAADEVDIGGAVSDASSGNWLGLALKVLGIAGALGGAYELRRRHRKRKKTNAPA